MRITFVISSLDLSGGSRVIATHARMLAESGHSVTVVVPQRRPFPLRRRLRELIVHGRWETGHGAGSHYDDLGLDVRVVDHRPIVEADVPDADVVIATWWETAEWVNALSAKKGVKVYFVQGHEVFDNLPLDRVRATYRMPFVKIVVSGWLGRIMKETYGDANSILVPNAVDHSVFYADPRGKQVVPTVGFMYSLGSVKAIEVAIDAIRKLRDKVPSLRVVSFGVVPPRGLEDFKRNLQFTLRPDGRQLRDAYSACDVWMCSSKSEGFGLPAMEAMACRTPVVSTRVGWPLDSIQNGINGFLVPVDDSQALCEAAETCLTIANKTWLAMSQQAHQTAQRYQWRETHARFEAALTIALRGPPR